MGGKTDQWDGNTRQQRRKKRQHAKVWKEEKKECFSPFLECNLLDNGNIIAVNPLKIGEGGRYTYTLAALALSRHSYSNYAPYGLHFYFYLTWVVFFY